VLNPRQLEAIDGVARTLWGEAGICPHQMEAIGRVIVDRTLKVNQGIGREYDRPEMAGQLLPVERVISRTNQFSGWNSETQDQVSFSSLLKEMPGAPRNVPSGGVIVETAEGPWHLNQLCPQISRNSHYFGHASESSDSDLAWRKAVELAKTIVLDPEGYRARYQWLAPLESVYYYTHGPDIGMKRIPVTSIRDAYRGTKLHWEMDQRANCQKLRFFREP
jgi:hypothetical protein